MKNNNLDIEYIEDTHQYLVNGRLVPSVSQLTSFALNDEYSNIPKYILKKAADYGTRIHNCIEQYEQNGFVENLSSEEEKVIDEWVKIVEEHSLAIVSSEEMVFTEEYGGRYDVIANVNGVKTLIDIKTNSVYPKQHLEVQMGLYKYAIGEDLPCACIWWDKKKKTFSYKEVEEIDGEMVEKIVYCYKNKLESPYVASDERNEIVPISIYTPEESEKLKAFYALKKEIDNIEKNGKAKAMEYMKSNGIKSFENDDWKITYIEETTKTIIDNQKLKDDGIYETYLKQSPVKATVRITPKWTL